MENTGKAWEKRPEEPNLWYQRFEKYRLLGPSRSVSEIYLREWRQKRTVSGKDVSKPPKGAPGKWHEVARYFEWRERAEAWDMQLAAQAAERVEAAASAEIERVLTSGYAMRHKRVQALNDLAERLIKELEIPDNVWLPDIKVVGKGEYATVYDIKHFNAALIEQIRRTLSDIAEEMGERVKGVELSGKNGGPIPIQDAEEIRQKRWSSIAPLLAEVLSMEEGEDLSGEGVGESGDE